MNNLLEKVKAISQLPDINQSTWLESATDSAAFLKKNHEGQREIILYANAPHVFIQSVLVPTENVSPPDKEDLLSMCISPSDSWCIQRSHRDGTGHQVYLEPPLASSGCHSLAGGEKLIFLRPFEGIKSVKTQVEISQKLVHALGLHFVEEQRAYCRLDNKGDIQDIVKLHHDETGDVSLHTRLVSIQSEDLAKYMTLTTSSLVVKFDFTRFLPGLSINWGGVKQEYYDSDNLFYNFQIVSKCASYANGCFILCPRLTKADLVQEWEDETRKQFATFIIDDWKNKRHIETSCNPDHTANYFTESDSPFEVSPAFFNAEVLSRYKANPEKYTLTDRKISCRNSWYLDRYDINEEGQIHTYLRDLAKLPYEEQIYWKSFNEQPKGGISKRAHETDFSGECPSEDDPLDKLRAAVFHLDQLAPPWWKCRGQELIDSVHYPATNSPKGWAGELLALDQILVEGFQVGALRDIADENNIIYEDSWRSLKLLEMILVAKEETSGHAKKIMKPFRELHALRTLMKAHADPKGQSEAIKKARADFGTFRNQFKDLVTRLNESVKSIEVAILEE